VTGEQLTALLEDRHAKDPTFRPLIAEEDGVPVGHIMVKVADPVKKMVHIGLFILNPEQRGKGLGSRMLRQVLDEVIFGEMGAELADLRVFLCNTRARACYERLGFREMGTGVISMDLHGEIWDAVDLVIEK
jgi:RimJ/RimL family protein N-acetyltransferase